MDNHRTFRKISFFFIAALFSAVFFSWFSVYAQNDEPKESSESNKQSPENSDSFDIPEVQMGSNADIRGKIENLAEGRDDDYLILDDNTILWFYRVKHKDASVLAKYLPVIAGAPKKMFVFGSDSLPVGLAANDRRTISHPADTLIIEDTIENIEKFKRYLKIIDIPKPQVLIEARIIEIKHSSEFHFGFDFDWDKSKISHSYFQGLDLNYSPDNWIESLKPGSSAYQGLNFNFASIGQSLSKFGIGNLSLRMMSALDEAEIMSSPRLIIEEGAFGEITSGESLYLYSVTERSGRITISPIAKQIGIVLKIRPLFIGEKTVKLRLQPSVSEILGYAKSGTYSNPIFATRNIDTVTTVEYGKTLILGGLIINEKTVKTRGIPFLSDIPLLGELFKSHDRYTLNSELFFIITPKIIDVTNPRRMVEPFTE